MSATVGRAVPRWGVIAGACIPVMAFWMRREIANRFQLVLGNGLDGRIQISLTEHWYAVLRGMGRWDTPSYFYPWDGTLGYNDGYFLFGVIAALFRLLGTDPFLAFNGAAAVIAAIGFVSCALLAVDALGMGVGYAVLAATVFTIADNAACQRGHSQLLTVAFAPLLFWLAFRCLVASRVRADGAALGWGTGAAALYAAWLLTSFYMLWFTTFFALLLLTFLIGLQIATKRGRAGLAGTIRQAVLRRPVLASLALAALGLVPFLHVYLPKAAETGAHPFEEVLFYSPSLPDLVHFGADNWLFGALDQWFTGTFRPDFLGWSEHLVGFPPFLALFGLLGAAAALSGRPSRSLLWPATALATLLCLALVIQVGGHTLWYGVFALVPGASAIRVTTRFALFLDLPLAILAVGWVAQLGRRCPAWLRAACLVLLVLEEATSFSALDLDRHAEMQRLDSVPPAPASCRAFVVSRPWPRASSGNVANDALYTHNVDAMILAALRGLPTVNGIATFTPPDWPFADAASASYPARVESYVRRHHLAGMCEVDLAAGAWRPLSPTGP